LADLRRIVTGHGANGEVIITSDSNLPDISGLDFAKVRPVWLTTETPSKDCNNPEDGALRKTDDAHGLVRSNGTHSRATDLAPGAKTPMHRTASVDVNILVQGEIILILEDGSETHLKNAGDTVVQRGTMHAWRNPGTTWCRWITVLIDAEPAKVDGKPLESVWDV
jgi:quercetin dioxygenase-like cupin family protein